MKRALLVGVMLFVGVLGGCVTQADPAEDLGEESTTTSQAVTSETVKPSACAVAALTGQMPAGASEAEIAACSCSGGRLCGGQWLPLMPCGTVVCGYDKKWYTCTNGSWQSGGACSC